MFREPTKPLVDPPKPALDFLAEAADKEFKIHRIAHDHYQVLFYVKELRDGTPVLPETEAVDRAFETFRRELVPYSFLATLEFRDGEGYIRVERRRDPSFRSSRLNWVLFVVTLATVQFSGALAWASYLAPPGPDGVSNADYFGLEAMAGGFVYFTVPLLGIIGLHEMGHFFTARHYGVRASLPFFLPNLPPLGTFGAAISLRDPFPNRKVAFDVGLSGPVIGFLAAIGVTVVGVVLMQAHPSPTRPEAGGVYYLGEPLIFTLIVRSFSTPDSYLHPTLFAGWAGFLVTAFNLVPAAQLDGGHVSYAMLKSHPQRERQAMWISVISVALIAGISTLLGYPGWLLLALIVFITLRHPPPLNQISALGAKRVFAGIAAIAIFLVSFVPVPLIYAAPDYAYDVIAEPVTVEVPAGGFANYSFNVTNGGNTFNPIEVSVLGSLGPFTAVFSETRERTVVLTNKLEYERAQVNVTVVSLSRAGGDRGAVQLLLRPVNDAAQVKTLVVSAHSGPPHPAVTLRTNAPNSFPAGNTTNVYLTAYNIGDVPLNLSFSSPEQPAFGTWGFDRLGNFTANASITPGHNVTLALLVLVPSETPSGTPGRYTVVAADESYAGVRSEAVIDFVVA